MNRVAELIEPEKQGVVPESSPAAGEEGAEHLAVTVIERRRGWQFINLGELWRYRELLYFLAWRDVKVRYKQTVLGVAWAVLQPFATMVVFSLFFGRLAELPGAGAPYPLFVFAGLLPWFFFSNAITSASQSVVGSQNLVTKVYFPRLMIPLGAVGPSVLDFLVSFAMLLALMGFYALTSPYTPHLGWQLCLVPLLSVGLLLAAIGVGTLLSALTVAYRDFRYVVPFMVQLWMFATPSIYMTPPTGEDSPRWWLVLPLNPAYGLIANFRAAVLGGPLDPYSLAVSSAVGLMLLVAGCGYFRRVERSFADII